jgi:hypothetical protein
MSVIGMARAASGGHTRTLGEAEPPDFLGRLIAYIPADIVAGYVAVFALVDGSDPDFSQEWITFAVFLALTPIVLVAVFLRETRRKGQRGLGLRDWPWLDIAIAMIAFVAWAFALPDTPFRDLADITGFWQMLVLVATTLVLAAIGQAAE